MSGWLPSGGGAGRGNPYGVYGGQRPAQGAGAINRQSSLFEDIAAARQSSSPPSGGTRMLPSEFRKEMTERRDMAHRQETKDWAQRVLDNAPKGDQWSAQRGENNAPYVNMTWKNEQTGEQYRQNQHGVGGYTNPSKIYR